MQIKTWISVIAILVSLNLTGQDLHFTQFNLAPMNLNPALTGAYLGTYRAGLLYRDQYRTVNSGTARPYQTATAFIDSPIIGGFRKQDWIGLGANFFYDQAGTAQVKNIGTILSLAYHLGLGKKGDNVFTLGAQYGSIQRRFDRNQSITGWSLANSLGAGSDPDLASLTTGNAQGSGSEFVESNYNFLSVGTMLTSSMGKNSDLRMGVSVSHFLRPGQSLTGGLRADRKYVKTAAFVSLYSDLGGRFTFKPQALFQTSGGINELVIQGIGAFLLNEEKEMSFNAGLGVRAANALDLQVLLGMDIKDIRVGVAYDFNLASFNPATNGHSGFELGVTYIGKVYKKPKVEPVLICPRL